MVEKVSVKISNIHVPVVIIGKQQGAKIICTIQKQINDLAFAIQRRIFFI